MIYSNGLELENIYKFYREIKIGKCSIESIDGLDNYKA